MACDLEIKTKIAEEDVKKALDEFVKVSWERTKGKSVSTWKKLGVGKYLLSIAYIPENPIANTLLKNALAGSFKKQDKTATVEYYKKGKK